MPEACLVVLHEFAHVLDFEDGEFDGTPVLPRREQYASWVAVMEGEYERLRRDSALNRYSVLDYYGAKNPAEFFAVATEAFFEKPTVLAKRHPELYAELRAFYGQDPANSADRETDPTADRHNSRRSAAEPGHPPTQWSRSSVAAPTGHRSAGRRGRR